MTNEICIPLLPCHSIDEMLAFYRALDFEVTYQQTKPNLYAVVQRGGIELHFFAMQRYEPANSYSSCYVRTSDVDALYAAFIAGLRKSYGRLPCAGIPQVIPLKNKAGRREFIVVDPGGNWIRIGQPNAAITIDEASPKTASKLARALHTATLLAESKGDYPAVANTLDVGLAADQPALLEDRIQALVFRAGSAITMDDQPLAEQLLSAVQQTPLSDVERASLAEVLQHADDLAQSLR